jgi:hypothetical protein
VKTAIVISVIEEMSTGDKRYINCTIPTPNNITLNAVSIKNDRASMFATSYDLSESMAFPNSNYIP